MRNFSDVCRKLSLLVVTAVAVACSGGDGLDADSMLARDLTLAGVDTSLPEIRDTIPLAPPPTRAATRTAASTPPVRRPTPPPPPAPVVTAPVPTPVPEPTPAPVPAAAPRRLIAAGTTMSLTTGLRVCTTNKPGDKLTATLTETVVGEGGAIIPAGSRAVVEVVSVTPGNEPTDVKIVFRVRSILTDNGTLAPVGQAVPLDPLDKERVEGKTSDAKKVAAGAIAGAILGQVIGKDTKGTVIGAAAGAAAGTAAAAMGAKYQGCLKEGGRIQLALSEPLLIT